MLDMPLLKLETTVAVSEEKRKSLLPALSKAVAELNATLSSLSSLYKMLSENGMYPVVPKPIRPIGE